MVTFNFVTYWSRGLDNECWKVFAVFDPFAIIGSFARQTLMCDHFFEDLVCSAVADPEVPQGGKALQDPVLIHEIEGFDARNEQGPCKPTHRLWWFCLMDDSGNLQNASQCTAWRGLASL